MKRIMQVLLILYLSQAVQVYIHCHSLRFSVLCKANLWHINSWGTSFCQSYNSSLLFGKQSLALSSNMSLLNRNGILYWNLSRCLTVWNDKQGACLLCLICFIDTHTHGSSVAYRGTVMTCHRAWAVASKIQQPPWSFVSLLSDQRTLR